MFAYRHLSDLGYKFKYAMKQMYVNMIHEADMWVSIGLTHV